jgi:putative thioredoxin
MGAIAYPTLCAKLLRDGTANMSGLSISVNHENFATDVLQKSHEKPVLVDFFAQWCGPCKMLKPILEKLVQEYDFVLAKVDIDASPDLAQNYQVEGVPDVRVVINGQVQNGFVGVLPEPKLREFLARLNLRSILDRSLDTVFAEAAQGRVEQAKVKLADLLQRYPENRQLIVEAASFYIDADEMDKAEALLAPIQEYEKEAFTRARGLKALIQFKQLVNQPAQDTAQDSDLDQSFRQAVQSVLAQDYDRALEQFLEIVHRDRRYRDDGARKAMLAVFDLLGDDNPLVRDYRKRLMMALY